MSTLIEELERAARRVDCIDVEGRCSYGCSARDLAARLRARIEHVKRLLSKIPSKADVELFDVLTGDLP